MGRPKRTAPGGLIYHVLNRANARMTIFKKDEDYEAMQRIMLEAVERTKIRILAYCPTIGILYCGRERMASFRSSPAG